MNIEDLIVELRDAEEQLFQAELKLDQVTDPILVDAAIFEQKAWENICKYYRLKLREAVAGGQAIQRNGLVYFGDRC
ncbi:MAG TPA: hypothetical protein GX514_06875 [Thermoanaerobacterales bacterium]|nr:hypothetical protein [Thermoanaerobacterales bacterium]